MSKGKSTGVKSTAASSYIPEPLPSITPVPLGTDPENLPFLAWSDQNINAEKWDLPKAKDKGKASSPSTDEPTQFTDPQRVLLPPSMQVEKWKRPSEFFTGKTLIMYKESSEYPDLISNCKHILHSDFMRSYISAIGILEYLGNYRSSPIEFATPTYVPNTSDVPWRPWHHIYSLCKAGKGQKHNPQVNTLGKYALRLFWMGCWRKIMIDDLIPIDITKHVLLPCLDISSVTQEIELWPLLLCKGLLKLCSLSSTQYSEMRDFDIIQCFTGWYVQTIDVEGLDVVDIWDMCAGYSDHFAWPELPAKSEKSGTSTPKPKSVVADDSSMVPYHLIASCVDMKTLFEDQVPDMSPCWSHWFLIDQTREIPLIKPDPLPELARWKRFRWLTWAIQKGIWPAPQIVPIKCFKMVSVFKKVSEHVIYTVPSKESINIKNNVAVVDEVVKGQDKKDDKGSSVKSVKSDKPVQLSLPPDPSIWGDFNKLGHYIKRLYIFFKTSPFRKNVKITDVSQPVTKDAKADKGKKGAGPVTGPESQTIVWNNELLKSRNEPIYIFCDSIDYKLIVLNFSQVGNINALKHWSDPCHCERSSKMYEPVTDEISCDSKDQSEECLEDWFTFNRPPFAYAVVENYNWQSNKTNDVVTFLNTYGSKTVLMDINPGRFVARMWIKSDTSFNIHLLSDTPIVVGTLETVLESMRQDPETLLQTCHAISSTYGQLVQKFGTPEFHDGLKTFYKSYLPNFRLTKKQLVITHSAFMEEFMKLINKNSVPLIFQEKLFALKVMFINPFLNFPIFEKPHKNIESDYHKITSFEDVELIKQTEKAAVVIQAFFKKIFIRKLKSLHKEFDPNYLKVFNTLKSIYSELFSVNVRMFTGLALIRSFLLNNPDMESLRTRYSLFYDLNNNINLQYFTGVTICESNSWVPITRYTFYCNSPNLVMVKIALFCDVEQYVVRVFNNDDNTEILRYINDVVVHEYKNNAYGYTVLCYGWSKIDMAAQWKLHFITLKQNFCCLLIIPEVSIYKYVLKENYQPNYYNYICRCLISINHDVSVTFRLSTCYENVKIYLRCVNEVGQIFGEVSGIQNVILPIVTLKYLKLTERIKEMAPDKNSLSESNSNSPETRTSKVGQRSSILRKYSKRNSKNYDRYSLDKYSTKGSSVISIKRHGSSSVLNDVLTYKDTVYLIEGYVQDDTWPLSKREWGLVKDLNKESLLNPSFSEFDTMRNLPNMTKLRESLSSRRSKEKRKSSTTSDVKIVSSPLWCLETISSVEDSVTATIDKRREEEIKEIKRKWYEIDFRRYEKSKQLRTEYLEANYIKIEEVELGSGTFPGSKDTVTRSVELSDIPEESQSVDITTGSASRDSELDKVRTLRRPVSVTSMLPPFDLEMYVEKRDVAKRSIYEIVNIQNKVGLLEAENYVKTAEDEEQLIKLRERKMNDFKKYEKCFQKDMARFLIDQQEQLHLLNLFYDNCRQDSKQLMNKAYGVRDKVIEDIIEEYENLYPSLETKDEKKGKK